MLDEQDKSALDPVERKEAGRAQRAVVPRSAHADWSASPTRSDPLSVLEAQAATRVSELGPIRYERMSESPFAFYRGAAAVMAMDLADTPSTEIRVQACGDADVNNFGKFASPERNLVFDINDFDETVPGPWEWDIKRLAASLQVVARQREFSPADAEAVVTVRSYRERIADYATWPMLALWYERTEIKTVIEHFPMRYRGSVEHDADRARRKDHLRAVNKLTEVVDGRRRFIEDPPLVVHLESTEHDLDDVRGVIESYRANLSEDRRSLFDRFRLLDVARKVVGVGSVGTRCWIALFGGADDPEHDLIVLQVKEAQASVLEPYVGVSELGHNGKRVVVGQRLVQAAGDIFLAWCDGPRTGNQYYVRQLWDLKGQGDPLTMAPRHLRAYGELCAWILARSHVCTGDAVRIAGYLGKGSGFDRAIASFARLEYAITNERDHAALVEFVRSRRS